MGQGQVLEGAVVELRERLVATVSHEFRTPLAVIQASAGLIRRRVGSLSVDERDAERMLASCERIEQATSTMVAAIERVLLIDRISAGDEPHRPRPCVPGDVLMSLTASLQERGDVPREVLLDVQQAQVPGQLDPLVLRQVATQLLDNAFKYSSPDSAVTLHARCDGMQFHLRVSDHGIGIDAVELPLLFEPFHRAPAARDLPGMGLGLTLVRQLLQLADGRIRIESTPHVGTTVSVSLAWIPAAKVTAP
jgi:signal transduction histidine kinase